jgi:hypothetical protein
MDDSVADRTKSIAQGNAGAEASPRASGPPIFVVGSMRSGSTLLRLILDSHPNIAIGPETGFMGGLLATRTIPNWKFGDGWYRRLGWRDEEFDACLRSFFGSVLERYAVEQGKPRWGEKTPFHTSHMPLMARIFPDAVFVGIVRHPGAVASSLRKSFHYTFADALSYWSATNLDMVRAASDLGERFALCRYEDLVDEGEPVLQELLGWLGEPWSPDVLAHHRVQREKGAPRVVEGSTSTRDRIDAARAVSWLQTATTEDHEALRSTEDLADFFGYKRSDPTPRADPPSDGGHRRWITRGDDLARRRLAYEDRVDFDAHPPTLVIDANPQDLAERLAQVERALARTRTRRSVRAGEALRQLRRSRSVTDLRSAWGTLRSLRQ